MAKPPLSDAWTFTSMLLEIRREVYSYLLLDVNTVRERNAGFLHSSLFGCDLLKPLFSTSLFTVNKKISLEALEYFYQGNAFVAITTHQRVGFEMTCVLFPCFVWNDRNDLKNQKFKCLSKAALNISLDYGPVKGYMSNSGDHTVVFAARRLETAIRVLNSVHLRRPDITKVKVTVHFFSSRPYYIGNEGLRNRFIKDLKTLKTSSEPGRLASCSLAIFGMIDDSRATELQYSLDIHRTEDPLNEITWVFEQGDLERSRGEYKIAENYYQITRFLSSCELGVLGWRGRTTFTSKAQSENINIERYMRLALTYMMAREYRSACTEAAYGASCKQQCRWSYTSNEQRASLYTMAGDIIASTGDYNSLKNLSRAAMLFSSALELLDGDGPQRQDIQAKLSDAVGKAKQKGMHELLVWPCLKDMLELSLQRKDF